LSQKRHENYYYRALKFFAGSGFDGFNIFYGSVDPSHKPDKKKKSEKSGISRHEKNPNDGESGHPKACRWIVFKHSSSESLRISLRKLMTTVRRNFRKRGITNAKAGSSDWASAESRKNYCR
jgi:hypothetical protein